MDPPEHSQCEASADEWRLSDSVFPAWFRLGPGGFELQPVGASFECRTSTYHVTGRSAGCLCCDAPIRAACCRPDLQPDLARAYARSGQPPRTRVAYKSHASEGS